MGRKITRGAWRRLPPAARDWLWPRLSPTDKARLRDAADLSMQLIGLEGWRVEVITLDGQTRRFNVGITDDWMPQHLELSNTRSKTGALAERKYLRVTPLRPATGEK